MRKLFHHAAQQSHSDREHNATQRRRQCTARRSADWKSALQQTGRAGRNALGTENGVFVALQNGELQLDNRLSYAFPSKIPSSSVFTSSGPLQSA